MRSNEPLVTIRVAAYNHEQFIEKAIMSILHQNYRNIELVVVDDGSTDNTPSILRELRSRYDFHYEEQPNQGLTATLNKIHTKYTNGKYVKGCASDDELPPNAILELVGFMERNPEYGACYGHAYVIDACSTVIGQLIGGGQSGWLYEKLLLGQAHITLPTMMWRTEALSSVGLYDESIPTEDIYMLRKISKHYPIGFINSFVYHYRRHATNTSRDAWKMYMSAKRVAEAEKIDNQNLRAKYLRRQQLYWFYSLSREYKREALKYFLPAATFFPSRFFIAGCLNILGICDAASVSQRIKQVLPRYHP